MELRRTFGVDGLLRPETAAGIYEHCSKLLRTREFSVRSIIRKYNVDALCTTDDPVDSLEHHRTIRESGFETLVAPTFRPDRALDAHLPKVFNEWRDRLEVASGVRADSFGWFIEGLKRRHRFFHEQKGRLSDYGIEIPYASDWTTPEVEQTYAFLRSGRALSSEILLKFRSAVLYELLVMDHDQG